MKVGDSVKIEPGRKEEGKIGTIKFIRSVPSGHDYVVFFEDGDSNDFRQDEITLA
jgi:ribosomal protein S4E